MNFEPIEITHDQQRRVIQVLAIKEKLLVSLHEIAAFTLVFPSEMIFHPNIGPALATTRLFDTALERVPGAVGIGVRGFRLA